MVLLAGLAFAEPFPPLSSFGLTPQALERLGFNDSGQGLLEIAAARWYKGPEREAKLRELAGRAGATPRASAPVAAPERREPPARFEVNLPQPGDATTLDRWFDGGVGRGQPAAAELPAGPGRAGGLSPALPVERRQPLRDLPVPLSAGGLQARGEPVELARWVASRLPGFGAPELAAAGTLEAWKAVDSLVARYAGRARLPAAGWEQEAAEAYRDGFAGRWGDGRQHVTVVDDHRLFAHRGLWVGNPVLRRPDGSLELVLNLPWMQTIAQDGAFADARLVRIREALAALDGAERTRLIETALGGRDPQALTYGLLYRLAGWMQADLLRAGPAAGPGRIESHPVWRTIYYGALNAAVSLTKGMSAGTTQPELWKPASDADLWRLVREANAGSASAAQELGARLEAAPAMVGYAQYLDLGPAPNRAAALRAAAAAPLACRVSGRLAQAREPAGIDLFAQNCLGAGARELLVELSRRASDERLRPGYVALVDDLLSGAGDRSYEELAGRRRVWLAQVARTGPADAVALWDAAGAKVREALVAALAASGEEDGRLALAGLESARPEATQVRRTLAPDSGVVERAIRRSVEAPAARLESEAARQARRFEAQPQSFVRLLREPAVVAPLVAAARAGGVEVEYLTAVAFQEGYYLFADRLSQGIGGGEFTSKGPMGIDSFGDLAGSLKRRGLLRSGFDGYTVDGTWRNETGATLPLVKFRDAEAALEAMAAMIRHKRAQFLADARSLGLDPGSLSKEDLELWTYVYYNFRDPKSVLRRGLGTVRRFVGPDHSLYGAQRVGATAAYLRALGLFQGPGA